jgi:protein phosphatase 1G
MKDDDMKSGATCLVAVLHSKNLYIGNAGDSRAVLCRSGRSLRLSSDHKPLLEGERDRIKKLGGKFVEGFLEFLCKNSK